MSNLKLIVEQPQKRASAVETPSSKEPVQEFSGSTFGGALRGIRKFFTSQQASEPGFREAAPEEVRLSPRERLAQTGITDWGQGVYEISSDDCPRALEDIHAVYPDAKIETILDGFDTDEWYFATLLVAHGIPEGAFDESPDADETESEEDSAETNEEELHIQRLSANLLHFPADCWPESLAAYRAEHPDTIINAISANDDEDGELGFHVFINQQ